MSLNANAQTDPCYLDDWQSQDACNAQKQPISNLPDYTEFDAQRGIASVVIHGLKITIDLVSGDAVIVNNNTGEIMRVPASQLDSRTRDIIVQLATKASNRPNGSFIVSKYLDSSSGKARPMVPPFGYPLSKSELFAFKNLGDDPCRDCRIANEDTITVTTILPQDTMNPFDNTFYFLNNSSNFINNPTLPEGGGSPGGPSPSVLEHDENEWRKWRDAKCSAVHANHGLLALAGAGVATSCPFFLTGAGAVACLASGVAFMFAVHEANDSTAACLQADYPGYNNWNPY